MHKMRPGILGTVRWDAPDASREIHFLPGGPFNLAFTLPRQNDNLQCGERDWIDRTMTSVA